MGRIDPGHSATRDTLRVLGPLVLIVGIIFVVVGAIDFFGVASKFAGFPDTVTITRGPQLFWCFFVGIPLIGLGSWMTRFGYMGAVVRYVAEEVAPVASDTVNYVADETQNGIRTIAGAIAEGVRGSAQVGGQTIVCPACGAANDPDARFCDGCGAPLALVCPKCEAANDADARFCKRCGAEFTA